MSTLTKPKVPSDVFYRLGEDFAYHMETKEITNGTADDWDLPPGYPMDDNVAEIAAGIDGVDGLLYERTKVPAGETVKALVLARGPAVINADGLPAVDYAGAALVQATYVTNLLANIPQTVVRYESDTQATLTAEG